MRCEGKLLAHYDIFIPKSNTLLVVLFFITVSKGTLQYDCKDTLNSKIHQLVIILSQNKEGQYTEPPTAFKYLYDPTIKFLFQ